MTKENENRLAAFLNTFDTLGTPRVLALVFLGITVAAVAGPFGTFSSMDFPTRIFYWGLIGTSSVLFGYFGFALARALGFNEDDAAHAAVGSLIASFFITVDVWAISVTKPWGTQSMIGFWELFGYVFVVTAVIGALRYLLLTFLARETSIAEERDEALTLREQPRLARRLPDEMGEDILYLSVRDHMVDVFTEAGQTSLRMRFRDALDEMDGVPGYRVHRSHWVAHHAVQGVERDQARVYLRLPDGRKVPVSRNYRPELEDAGLL